MCLFVCTVCVDLCVCRSYAFVCLQYLYFCVFSICLCVCVRHSSVCSSRVCVRAICVFLCPPAACVQSVASTSSGRSYRWTATSRSGTSLCSAWTDTSATWTAPPCSSSGRAWTSRPHPAALLHHFPRMSPSSVIICHHHLSFEQLLTIVCDSGSGDGGDPEFEEDLSFGL